MTAPTFRTFTALAAGFLAHPRQRTVTGMLTGAGLAGVWHHTRAHRFFSAARWSVDQVGLTLLDMIVRLLIPRTPRSRWRRRRPVQTPRPQDLRGRLAP